MKKILFIAIVMLNTFSFQAKADLTQEEKETILNNFLSKTSEDINAFFLNLYQNKSIESSLIKATSDCLQIMISKGDQIRIWNPEDNICKAISRLIVNNFEQLCSSLTWLTNLNLPSCNISSLPRNFNNLSKLKELYLNENHITTIPKEIGELTSLKALNFSGNNLETIHENIGQLSNLTYLDLSNNPNLRYLPESLKRLADSITHLNLKNTNIQYFSEGRFLGKHELQKIFGDRVVFSCEEDGENTIVEPNNFSWEEEDENLNETTATEFDDEFDDSLFR
ncbi:MAG: hypothetical protein Q8L85_06160 [Alphaproteobacteria bacterium]|nr:hypothetical protein [Alphaproteobacteria bacterium]